MDKLSSFEKFLTEQKMTTLYHVTTAANAKKILKTGIIPNKGKGGASYNQAGGKLSKKGYLYAMESFQDAVRWALRMSWGLDYSKDLSLIKIIEFKDDVDQYEHDTHFDSAGGKGRWVMKQGVVEPSQIIRVIDLHENMGKRLVQLQDTPEDSLSPDEDFN